MNSTQVPGTRELGGPAPEEIQKQLARILHSKAFRHASALQRLLQYLITRAIEDPFGDIKEYTIGTEVFERGADYDPQSDTIVRVQVHRLRLKVKEYYESEGVNDPIVIEIPKGHYIPAFETRSVATPKENGSSAVIETAEEARVEHGTPSEIAAANATGRGAAEFFSRRFVLVALILLIFGAGIWLGVRWGTSRASFANAVSAKNTDPAESFWRGFFTSDSAPVVGYADAVYLVDGAEDLFRFRRGASDNTGTLVEAHLAQQFASSPDLVAKAGPLYYEDGNTGTGDLESVFALAKLFTRMNLQMSVKRCRLITIDDLRQHDVILLGSPEENDAVAQLAQPSDFVWKRLNVPGPWKGEYVNQHPQAGEALTFTTERDPNTQELKTDYGLITLQPGAAPNRYIAVLAGLDTSGVAGTAQYVTSPSDMAELKARLASLSGWTGEGVPPSFQALLRVDVQKGHDVMDVHLIAVHMTPPDKNASPSLATSGF